MNNEKFLSMPAELRRVIVDGFADAAAGDFCFAKA